MSDPSGGSPGRGRDRPPTANQTPAPQHEAIPDRSATSQVESSGSGPSGSTSGNPMPFLEYYSGPPPGPSVGPSSAISRALEGMREGESFTFPDTEFPGPAQHDDPDITAERAVLDSIFDVAAARAAMSPAERFATGLQSIPSADEDTTANATDEDASRGPSVVIVFRDPSGGLGLGPPPPPPQFGPFGPTPQAFAMPADQTQPRGGEGPQPTQPGQGAPPQAFIQAIQWRMRNGIILFAPGVPADPRVNQERADELLRSLPDVTPTEMHRIDGIVKAENAPSGSGDLAAEEDEVEGWHCGICLEGIDDWSAPSGLGVKALPCNHFYHGECLRGWFVTNRTCPMCRLELDPLRTLDPSQRPLTRPGPQIVDRNTNVHPYVRTRPGPQPPRNRAAQSTGTTPGPSDAASSTPGTGGPGHSIEGNSGANRGPAVQGSAADGSAVTAEPSREGTQPPADGDARPSAPSTTAASAESLPAVPRPEQTSGQQGNQPTHAPAEPHVDLINAGQTQSPTHEPTPGPANQQGARAPMSAFRGLFGGSGSTSQTQPQAPASAFSMFGARGSSNLPRGGLFGGFGSTPQTQLQASGSTSGMPGAPGSSTFPRGGLFSGLFGGPGSTPRTQSPGADPALGPFGTRGGLFSTPGSTPQTQPGAAGSAFGLFGTRGPSTPPQGGLFGGQGASQQAGTQPPPPPPTGSLFGGIGSLPQGGLFGGQGPSNQTGSQPASHFAGGLFGGAGSSILPPAGLFGAQNPSATASPPVNPPGTSSGGVGQSASTRGGLFSGPLFTLRDTTRGPSPHLGSIFASAMASSSARPAQGSPASTGPTAPASPSSGPRSREDHAPSQTPDQAAASDPAPSTGWFTRFSDRFPGAPPATGGAPGAIFGPGLFGSTSSSHGTAPHPTPDVAGTEADIAPRAIFSFGHADLPPLSSSFSGNTGQRGQPSVPVDAGSSLGANSGAGSQASQPVPSNAPNSRSPDFHLGAAPADPQQRMADRMARFRDRYQSVPALPEQRLPASGPTANGVRPDATPAATAPGSSRPPLAPMIYFGDPSRPIEFEFSFGRQALAPPTQTASGSSSSQRNSSNFVAQPLSSWINARERSLGWRCDDPHCQLTPPPPDDHHRSARPGGPTRAYRPPNGPAHVLHGIFAAEEPLYADLTPGAPRIAHTTCSHRWHRACLERLERAAGRWRLIDATSEVKDEFGDGRLWVNCPQCSKVGWVPFGLGYEIEAVERQLAV